VAERAVQDLKGDPVDVAFFDQLMVRHLPRAFMRVMRRLPAEPRCRLCNAPYGGIGGSIMRRFGFGPSRKNPTLCNTCFERAPMGGVDMEIGVLFADVRGFTSFAERTPTDEVVQLLNRFYAAASAVLFERLATRPGNATATTLGLKGKQDAAPARVIDLSAATIA
jgi:adenylate cyclase